MIKWILVVMLTVVLGVSFSCTKKKKTEETSVTTEKEYVEEKGEVETNDEDFDDDDMKTRETTTTETTTTEETNSEEDGE